MLYKNLFLDANAHVPLDIELYKNSFNLSDIVGYGHPLSPSKPGRNAAKIIEFSREKIAEYIGAESSNQIIFTRGCTQACEWGLKLFCEVDCNDQGKIVFATSSLEHPAVAQAVDKFTDIPCDLGWYLDYMDLEISKNGIIKYTENIDKLVCIHTHNETGVIQPIDKMNIDHIFSDMAQSLGKVPVNVTELGVDVAVFSAHKFGGPSSVGWFYLKNTDVWKEFGTGSRYSMDIPGTPCVTDIFATAVALEQALKTAPERAENMLEFTKTLERGIKGMGCKVIGEGAERAPNTSFIQLPKGTDSRELLLQLDNYGIHCGLGSACNSLYGDKSDLMEAMGQDNNATRYMRISQWGEYDSGDASYLLDIIEELL